MNRTAALLVGVLFTFVSASIASASSTITLEKTHLCCGKCVKEAQEVVSKVDGAKAVADADAKTIAVTAPDDATAQKAIDALVAAGFYGQVNGTPTKDDSGTVTGQVKSLTVSGFHNCCGKCAKAINAVVKSVPGATGEVKAKEESVTVTGDFDAQALVKAFHDAGFSVKVSQ